MTDNATQIANLLYCYAECIDTGNLEGAAALFRNARVKTHGSDSLLGEVELAALWRSAIIIYPCGTPRTKHVITNPIIEIDDSAGTALCRSYYTVVQAVDGFGLQVIASGRYHDEFERVDGMWRFSYRDYSLLDSAGDLSRHLTFPVTREKP